MENQGNASSSTDNNKIPNLVKFFAILCYIYGGFGLIVGLPFTIIGISAGLPWISYNLTLPFGIIFTASAIFSIFLGRGLWRGQRWSRIAVINLAAWVVLSYSYFTIVGYLNAAAKVITILFVVGISGLIGGYFLLSKKIKQVFLNRIAKNKINSIIITIVLIIACIAIAASSLFFFFPTLALPPQNNSNVNFVNREFNSQNSTLLQSDFVIMDKKFLQGDKGNSWCNNASLNQTDTIFVYVKENPILSKYTKSTYADVGINGQIPENSPGGVLYGLETSYPNEFILLKNFQANHPNNVTLCFQVNDTSANILSNQVCLDSFEIPAEC